MQTVEDSACSKALTSEWYDHLKREVDYHCSFCDAVHSDIHALEDIVKKAYAITATSLRGVHEIDEIAKRWFGILALSSEILAHGRFLQQSHQICGIDLTILERYQMEALERFQLHCPEFADSLQHA